jgi:hypothetical protein
MKRTLFLSALVAGVALALAAGSYSALAGSDPVTDVAGVVTGVDDPDADPDADDVDDDDDDDADADDADPDDGDGDGDGAQNVADVIGSTFDGASQEDVLALHDAGFGFGAIFKLYLLAAAGDETAAAILSSGEKGEGGFAFGKLFKELTDEVSVLTDGEDGLPTNLGKAVSGSKKGDTEATGAGTDDGDEDDGQGPPEHAPAHGRNKD